MLSQEYRQKLDGIVAKMDSVGAPAEDIRAIVDDFKRKYDAVSAVRRPLSAGVTPGVQEPPTAPSTQRELATDLPDQARTELSFAEEPTTVQPAGEGVKFQPLKTISAGVGRSLSAHLQATATKKMAEGQIAAPDEQLDPEQQALLKRGKSLVDSGRKRNQLRPEEQLIYDYYKNREATKKVDVASQEGGQKLQNIADAISERVPKETQMTIDEANTWLNPDNPDLKSIHPKNVSKTAAAAATVALNSLPMTAESLAGSLVGTGVGTALGAAAGPVGAKAGGTVGGFVGGAIPMMHEEKGNWIQGARGAGIDDPKILNELGGYYGLISGITEQAGQEIVLAPVKSLIKGGPSNALAKAIVGKAGKKAILSAIAVEVAKVLGTGVSGGTEESIQGMESDWLMGIAFKRMAEKYPERAQEIGENAKKWAANKPSLMQQFIAGGFAEMLMGGAGRVTSNVVQAKGALNELAINENRSELSEEEQKLATQEFSGQRKEQNDRTALTISPQTQKMETVPGKRAEAMGKIREGEVVQPGGEVITPPVQEGQTVEEQPLTDMGFINISEPKAEEEQQQERRQAPPRKDIAKASLIRTLVENGVDETEATRQTEERLSKLSEEDRAVLDESYQRMENKLYTDPLTTLRNRQWGIDNGLLTKKGTFDENIKRDMGVVDIDNFGKGVNNEYGHDVGDDVLRQIGVILTKNLREKAEVLRYGGEEIVILPLTGVSKDDIIKGTDAARKELAETEFADGKLKGITFSAGFGTDFKNADQSLLSAKAAGKARTFLEGNQYGPENGLQPTQIPNAGTTSGGELAGTELVGAKGAESAETAPGQQVAPAPAPATTKPTTAPKQAPEAVKPAPKPKGAEAKTPTPPTTTPPVTEKKSSKGGGKKRRYPITAEKYGQPEGTEKEYNPISNPETKKKAADIYDRVGAEGVEKALADPKTEESVKTALAILTASKLREQARKATGERAQVLNEKAMKTASDLAVRLTELGRAVEAVKVLHILNPETAAIFAQQQIDKQNKGKKESPKLTAEDATKIESLAEDKQAWEGVGRGSDAIKALLDKAKNGQKLTLAETQQLKDYRASITEVLGPEQVTPKKVKWNPKSTPRMRENAQSMRSAALARIAQRTKERYTTVSMELAPRDLPDYAIVGYSYVVEGAANLADFSAKMVSEFGDGIGPYVDRLYNMSKAMFNQDVIREKAVRNSLKNIGRIIDNYEAKKGDTGELAEMRQYVEQVKKASDEAQVAAIMGMESIIESKYTTPTLMGIVSEVWINGLLSAIPTHARNISGNLARSLYNPLAKITAASISAARAPFRGGKRDVYFGEAPMQIVGAISGIPRGLANAVKSFVSGKPTAAMSKLEISNIPQIRGPIGTIIRTPGRALQAADEFFKSMARGSDIAAQAYKTVNKAISKGEMDKANFREEMANLIQNPTPDMVEHAELFAERTTFTQPLGETGNAIMKWRERNPWSKLILPFVKTPLNIMKFVAENTPAAFIEKAVKISSGEITPENIDDELAKPVIGTALIALGTSLAASGLISGFGPRDKRKRELLYETGWQPYSIKTEDGYVSYGGIEPLGTILGLGADMHDFVKETDERTAQETLEATALAISNAFVSKSFLSGPINTLNAFYDPEKSFDRWYKQIVGSVVPAAVGVAARSIDPTVRRANTVGETLMARLPMVSKKLYPKRDAWGQPIDRVGTFWTRMMSPIQYSAAKGSKLDQELVDIGATIGVPTNKVTLNDDQREDLGTSVKNIELTPSEYDAFVKLAGPHARKAVESVMNTEEYKGADNEGKAKITKSAYDDVMSDYQDVIREIAIEREKTKDDGYEFTEQEILTKVKIGPVENAVKSYIKSESMDWKRAFQILEYFKMSESEKKMIGDDIDTAKLQNAKVKARIKISEQSMKFKNQIIDVRKDYYNKKITRSELDEKIAEIKDNEQEFDAMKKGSNAPTD